MKQVYIKCKYCNKIFLHKNKNKYYCSIKCSDKNKYIKHKEKIIERNKKYQKEKYIKKESINKTCLNCNNKFLTNREKHLYCSKKCYKYQYYLKNKTIEKIKAKNRYEKNKKHYLEIEKEYRKKHKKEINKNQREYFKLRRQNDIFFKLRQNLSIYAYQGLKKNRLLNKRHFSFTTQQLKEHLEKQFYFGVNWATYGLTWELGHKIPLDWFKNDIEGFYKIGWDLNNLFPILINENRTQLNKYALIDDKKYYSLKEALSALNLKGGF